MSKKIRKIVDSFTHLDYKVELFDTGMILVLGKSESGNTEYLKSSANGRELNYETGYVRLWNISTFQEEYDNGVFLKLLGIFDNFKHTHGFKNDDFKMFSSFPAENVHKSFLMNMIEREDISDSKKWMMIVSILTTSPGLAKYDDENDDNQKLVEEIVRFQRSPENMKNFSVEQTKNYLSPLFPHPLPRKMRNVEEYRKYLSVVCFLTSHDEITITSAYDQGFSFVESITDEDVKNFNKQLSSYYIDSEDFISEYVFSQSKKDYHLTKWNFAKFYSQIADKDFSAEVKDFIASRYCVDDFAFAVKNNPSAAYFLSRSEYEDFFHVIKSQGGNILSLEDVLKKDVYVVEKNYNLKNKNAFYQVLAHIFVECGNADKFKEFLTYLIDVKNSQDSKEVYYFASPARKDESDEIYSSNSYWTTVRFLHDEKTREVLLESVKTGIPFSLLMNLSS